MSDCVTKLEKIKSAAKLLPEQVYNVDETGLNLKRLPERTFSVGIASSTPRFKLKNELLKCDLNAI